MNTRNLEKKDRKILLEVGQGLTYKRGLSFLDNYYL